MQLVIFTLDTQRFALHLPAVVRVLPAMEITPLPNAPFAVAGLVNLERTLLPVFNTRRRFGFPERDLDPGDRFIVARTRNKTILLVVDDVTGVSDYPEDRVVLQDTTPGINELVSGVIMLDDGLVYIHDLDSFLSSEEEIHLDEAFLQFTKTNQSSNPEEKKKVKSDG